MLILIWLKRWNKPNNPPKPQIPPLQNTELQQNQQKIPKPTNKKKITKKNPNLKPQNETELTIW